MLASEVVCDLSVITLNSEKLFISSSGLCPSWNFYELLANWARKKWLYSKLVLIFETSRLTPFTLQMSPLSRAEWKFALHFTAPVHHFTGASHLKPMLQLNRTCRARTLFGIPPHPSHCSFLSGFFATNSLAIAGWAWRNCTRNQDWTWGDWVGGCCRHLGKGVGGLNPAINYGHWTGNIRVTLRSQKWESASNGIEREGLA